MIQCTFPWRPALEGFSAQTVFYWFWRLIFISFWQLIFNYIPPPCFPTETHPYTQTRLFQTLFLSGLQIIMIDQWEASLGWCFWLHCTLLPSGSLHLKSISSAWPSGACCQSYCHICLVVIWICGPVELILGVVSVWRTGLLAYIGINERRSPSSSRTGWLTPRPLGHLWTLYIAFRCSHFLAVCTAVICKNLGHTSMRHFLSLVCCLK